MSPFLHAACMLCLLGVSGLAFLDLVVRIVSWSAVVFSVSGCNKSLIFRDLFSIVKGITGIPRENIKTF